MSSKFMFFGTSERMAWVPCPAINAGLSTTRWSATSEYLNGGASSRMSAAAHGDYSFSWSPMSTSDIYSVLDFFDGTYGAGPYYFIDPFAQETNIYPSWLATPRIAVGGGPSFILDKTPTLTTTASNTLGYPTKSATYSPTATDIFNTFTFPIPTGYSLLVGAVGTASGTATLTLNGASLALTSVTSLDWVSSVTSNTSGDVQWSTLSMNGVGVITLTAIRAILVYNGSPTHPLSGFVSGRGNSGCSLKSNPVRTGYSAAIENASIGATVELIETGGWL